MPILKSDSNPALTHTLQEFLKAGENDTTIRFPNLLYHETNGSIEYTVKDILDDYMGELKEIALIVALSEEEYQKYLYNPKYLAYDIYGSTVLYPFIMALNGIANIREFDFKVLKLLRKSDLLSALSSIYNAEKNNIQAYNALHN